jgi:hypothetical protein
MIDIRTFKDLHFNKRAFLIGNGPSLKDTPLHLLNDEVTFSLNNISDYWEYTHPDTTWRPQYYYNTTAQAIRYRSWSDKANKAVKECHIAFIRDNMPIDIRENVCILNVFVKQCETCKTPIPGWSSDLTIGLMHYRMSMWGMAQLATYLGIKKIYLLGCDLGFVSDTNDNIDPNHFSDNYKGEFHWSTYLTRRENFYHQEAHQQMAKVLKDRGIEVFNATPGGELEAYPRVSLDDALKGKYIRII